MVRFLETQAKVTSFPCQAQYITRIIDPFLCLLLWLKRVYPHINSLVLHNHLIRRYHRYYLCPLWEALSRVTQGTEPRLDQIFWFHKSKFQNLKHQAMRVHQKVGWALNKPVESLNLTGRPPPICMSLSFLGAQGCITNLHHLPPDHMASFTLRSGNTVGYLAQGYIHFKRKASLIPKD